MSASMKRENAMSGRWRGPYTVKYRTDTAGRPKFFAYRRVMCSAASLVTPYGDTGRGRADSLVGNISASPYTEELPANRTRLIRLPFKHSRRRWVAMMLSRTYWSKWLPQLGRTPG